jgi:hypothetical protein
MHSDQIERLYKFLRVVIYAFSISVIAASVFLILFPVERFTYSAADPTVSKLDPKANEAGNEISFGAFPTLEHKYADLEIKIGDANGPCAKNSPEISLEKTYQAFLFPDAEPVNEQSELRDLLFSDNKSEYPNGSLLHLKPTNEVYLLTDGKKILFPGPEIFRAFGYSFDNLVEVEKSALDQFPDADNRVFLWTISHPDGTIFQAFPSHKLYIISDGKKREIKNPDVLKEIWPQSFSIPVNDIDPNNALFCQIPGSDLKKGRLFCRFDRDKLPSLLGGYYRFSLKLPENCPASEIQIKNISLRLVSEKTFATVKNSLRMIFGSILNRYFLKQ